jgi:hypothetical protein
MNYELRHCASTGTLERFKQLVEGGANIEGTTEDGIASLSLAILNGRFEIVVYLVGHGANVAHIDNLALHCACTDGNLPSVRYMLNHGARITERDNEGKTALLHAAYNGGLEVLQYLLSFDSGASITEADDEGNTALLLAAGEICYPAKVQWLLEYGGAQIIDTNNEGASVWTVEREDSLRYLLISAYAKDDEDEYISLDGEYVPTEFTVALTTMLRVMVLHGGPPESLTAGALCSHLSADRAWWRGAAGTAPSVPGRKAGPLRRPLPAAAATPGPGTRLRGPHHHRRGLGHGARGTPVAR